MQTRRASLCVGTMLMMIVLRLTIGWHFYTEGAKHLAEPHWSSEGFLRQAKGPLAHYYHSVLPPADFGLEATLHDGTTAPADATTQIDRWQTRVVDAWDAQVKAFREHYRLDDQQKEAVDKIGQRRIKQFEHWLDEHRDELTEHLHNWSRLQHARESKSAEEVPFERKRIDEALAKLNSESTGWVAHLRSIQHDLQEELDSAIEPEPGQHRPAARRPRDPRQDRPRNEIRDRGRGGLPDPGAVRPAALRWPARCSWLRSCSRSRRGCPTSLPTYPQLLEMLALFTLATVPVGRWCGLDFFLHYLVRPLRRRKASDEPHS